MRELSAGRARMRRLRADAASERDAGQSRDFGSHPHRTSMSQVTVSLPTDPRRSVPAGTLVRDIASVISPRLAKAALAGQVDDRLVDLDHPLTVDAARSGSSPPMRRGAAAAAPQRRAPAGGGRHEPLPRRAVWHRPGHRRRLLLRLRRPARLRAGGPRRHREEDARAGAAGSAVRASDLAARRSDCLLPPARRTAQGAADRRKDRRAVRRVLLHHQGPRHLRRLLRRTARPVDGPAQGVQAADAPRTPTGKATPATSRCSGCTAPRSSPTRSYRSTCTRIEEAKKRDHRKIGRDQKLFLFHAWAPGATFWLAKGTTLYNTIADYMRGVLFPAGYVEVKTPLIFNKALWETSGHWSSLPPEHVPHRERRRADGASRP